MEEETKDLESVETCQRKLETTERDMTAIEAKLKVCAIEFYKHIIPNIILKSFFKLHLHILILECTI